MDRGEMMAWYEAKPTFEEYSEGKSMKANKVASISAGVRYSGKVENNVTTRAHFSEVIWNNGVFNLSQPTKLTALESGIYLVNCVVRWDKGKGWRWVIIGKNGAMDDIEDWLDYLKQAPASSSESAYPFRQELNKQLYLTNGDYLEVELFQQCGSRLGATVEFCMTKIG